MNLFRVSRLAVRCAVATGALASFSSIAAPPATAAPPPGYSLYWSDEFHDGVGNQPSAKDWGILNRVHNDNNELEVYTSDIANSHIVADPRATDGQALAIIATSDNGVYKSARLSTEGNRHAFQYGFIEARIQLPYGQGIWPAFWMLGNNIGAVGWPKCGEVDIMENIGKESWWGTNESSLHSAGYPNGQFGFSNDASYYLPAGQTFHDGYHLFQMLWQKDLISFYVDGNLFETRTPQKDYHNNPWPFNAPFFFLLNEAVGGSWPGSPDATTHFPQPMLVDYVRVYHGQLKTPHAPSGLRESVYEGNVTINWDGRPDATSYNVYRSDNPGVPVQTYVTSTEFTDHSLVPGKRYAYRVAAVNPAGQSPLSSAFRVIGSRAVEKPYFGAPMAIPGVIQFADYDHGGEGIGYHNTDTFNQGGAFRQHDGVGIENCQDTGTGYDVGWLNPGEWLKYTVMVKSTGNYTITFRLAANADGGILHVEDENGVNLTGPVKVSKTGGWQTWQDFPVSANLTAGRHVLKVVVDSTGFNMNYMRITPQ